MASPFCFKVQYSWKISQKRATRDQNKWRNQNVKKASAEWKRSNIRTVCAPLRTLFNVAEMPAELSHSHQMTFEVCVSVSWGLGHLCAAYGFLSESWLSKIRQLPQPSAAVTSLHLYLFPTSENTQHYLLKSLLSTLLAIFSQLPSSFKELQNCGEKWLPCSLMIFIQLI